jgi:hypothetical protein
MICALREADLVRVCVGAVRVTERRSDRRMRSPLARRIAWLTVKSALLGVKLVVEGRGTEMGGDCPRLG